MRSYCPEPGVQDGSDTRGPGEQVWAGGRAGRASVAGRC